MVLTRVSHYDLASNLRRLRVEVMRWIHSGDCPILIVAITDGDLPLGYCIEWTRDVWRYSISASSHLEGTSTHFTRLPILSKEVVVVDIRKTIIIC